MDICLPYSHLWKGYIMFRKCTKCGKSINEHKISHNYFICPFCGQYYSIDYKKRVHMVLDNGSFIELNKSNTFINPINFPGYEEKHNEIVNKTGLKEAIIIGEGYIGGHNVIIGIMDTRYMMGSMGCLVGEKVTKLFEIAMDKRLPVILFVASGGARMQEGVFSLMQMAKTASAVSQFHEKGGLYISVITNPTMGGVSASFALLGDVILAEPKSIIGFAGKRVIEQTIGEKLPLDFQTAEFMFDCGYIDLIVERNRLKETLTDILLIHDNTCVKSKANKKINNISKIDICKDGKSAWNTIYKARIFNRFRSLEIINSIFDLFIELHGDRGSGDDKSIVAGIGIINKRAVTIIGQQKGNTIEEMRYRQCGMAKPEGYKKALRLMRQAEKFGRPIICLIDTPGAYPGGEAEANGQAEAIANNLFEMASFSVPIISFIIGEGGSGGAMALGLANKIIMLENAVFSVISPEGCASILYRDAKKAPDVAEMLKITAPDLLKYKIIDEIISECGTKQEIFARIKNCIERELHRFDKLSKTEIRQERMEKYRKIGCSN